MVCRMSIDLAKLRASVKRLSKGGESDKPNLTAIVRALLPEIHRLRDEENATWKVIALALAEQIPVAIREKLTEKRLTSTVVKLAAQDAKRAASVENRRRRSDILPLPGGQRPRAANTPPLRLADELAAQLPAAPDDSPLKEDEIRRLRQDKHKHLFVGRKV
jgi:hypothetical protein